jgi:hypothetical protein
MKDVHTAGADFPGITTLAPGAQWVASWEDGTPFVATKGDHVVGVNAFLLDGGYWTGDIPIVLHNAVLWATGARWLDVSPREGTVPSNGHLDITVGFDAADLFCGDYAAAIHVKNNDPLYLPDVAVSAALHVTGAPDIDVSTATPSDYGPQLIGAAIPDTSWYRTAVRPSRREQHFIEPAGVHGGCQYVFTGTPTKAQRHRDFCAAHCRCNRWHAHHQQQ